MNNSQHLKDASICTTTTESTSCVFDTENITSELVDKDYATISEDD